VNNLKDESHDHFEARLDAQAEAFNDIEQERDRQDIEFGLQVHDPSYWYAIIGKQFGQLGTKVIDIKWAADKDKAARDMYKEAMQTAACCVALMEAARLGELPDEITSAVPKNPRQRARALGRGHEAMRYDDVELPNESEGMSNDIC